MQIPEEGSEIESVDEFSEDVEEAVVCATEGWRQLLQAVNMAMEATDDLCESCKSKGHELAFTTDRLFPLWEGLRRTQNGDVDEVAHIAYLFSTMLDDFRESPV